VGELEACLRKRETENEKEILKRLERAGFALTQASHFDRVIVNDGLNRADDELVTAIRLFISR
jgi:guanylate kinase